MSERNQEHIYDEIRVHQKPLQQQSPSSFHQPVISRMVVKFLAVSLLLILVVMGIILSLNAVILVKITTTVPGSSTTV